MRCARQSQPSLDLRLIGETRARDKIPVPNWDAIDSMKSAEQKARERAGSEAKVEEVEKKVKALEKKNDKI